MDAELLQTAKTSDIAARALTQRMRDNLVAIGKYRDEAAFHDLYGHFSGRIKSYNPDKAAPSTWLFTIARNRRTDYLRGNSRIEVELDDEMLEIDSSEPTQEERVGLSQQSQILEQALNKLPQEQRQVLHLSYFRGKSHGAIAEWLDLPIGTVKSRIRLAMQSIRSEILPEEIG